MVKCLNPWLEHVRKYRKKHKSLSYKQCLINAKKTYKKKSSKKV